MRPTPPSPPHPMKIYLRQVCQLRREIDETRELLCRLRAQSEMATSRISAVRLSGTGTRDGTANAALRIVECQERLVRQISHMEEAISMRMVMIAQMPDARERRVLELKYLHGLDESQLCEKLCVGRTQLWRLHGKALESLKKVFDSFQNRTDTY